MKKNIFLISIYLLFNLSLNADTNSYSQYVVSQLDIKNNDKKLTPTANLCPDIASFEFNPKLDLGFNFADSLTGITSSLGDVSSKATNLVADSINNIVESLTGPAMMANVAIQTAAYSMAMVDCASSSLSASDIKKIEECNSETTANESKGKGRVGLQMNGGTATNTQTKPGIIMKCIQKSAGMKADSIWSCTKDKQGAYVDKIIKILNTNIQASLTTQKQITKECKLGTEIAKAGALEINVLSNFEKTLDAARMKLQGIAPVYKSNLLAKLNKVEYTLSDGRKITLFEDYIIKSFKRDNLFFSNNKIKKNNALNSGYNNFVWEDFSGYATFLYQYLEKADKSINSGNISAKSLRNLLKWLKNKEPNNNKLIKEKEKKKNIDQIYYFSPFYPKPNHWHCRKNNHIVELVGFEPKPYFTKTRGTYTAKKIADKDEIFYNTLSCNIKSDNLVVLNNLTTTLSYFIYKLVEQELIEGEKRFEVKIKEEREANPNFALKESIETEVTGNKDTDEFKEEQLKNGIKQYKKIDWEK